LFGDGGCEKGVTRCFRVVEDREESEQEQGWWWPW
jgi:hypothetical protein